MHPFLSTTIQQRRLPTFEAASALVAEELNRILSEGILVPATEPTAEGPTLVREKVPIDIGRVQQFVMTAPAQGCHVDTDPNAWYTNTQTEALCQMLGIENKVNPRSA